MHLSQDLFIYPHEDKWILWDYCNHQQFELDQDTWIRLNSILTKPTSFDPESVVDRSLFQSGILSTKSPYRHTWGWDILSKIYHIGTKNVQFETAIATADDWAKVYQEHCDNVLSSCPPPDNRSRTDDLRTIKLIDPKLSELDALLKNTLIDRQTCRVFHDNEVSLQDLSTLLHLALGFTTPLRGTVKASNVCALGQRRTSPSGGGLNSTEGYVYAKNIQGVKAGFYYYNPNHHTLEHCSPLVPAPLGKTLSGQHFIDNLPAGIWLTSRLDKLWWKYEHSRAYRMALIEVGHISQTLQLISTALGLQTWITGAFDDATIENQLQTEPFTEQPLFFIGIGHGENSAIPLALESTKVHLETV